MITWLLLSFSALCTAEHEKIKEGKKSIIPDWDLLKMFPNKYLRFLIKYPLSFLRDPWHCLKSVSITLLLIAFVIKAGQQWYYILVYYTIIGCAFNLNYDFNEIFTFVKITFFWSVSWLKK